MYYMHIISLLLHLILITAYIVWVSGELNIFTAHFIKQVFVPQTSISVLAECVILVRQQCKRVCKSEK